MKKYKNLKHHQMFYHFDEAIIFLLRWKNAGYTYRQICDLKEFIDLLQGNYRDKFISYPIKKQIIEIKNLFRNLLRYCNTDNSLKKYAENIDKYKKYHFVEKPPKSVFQKQFVYFLVEQDENGETSNYIKIGESGREIGCRIAGLQTGNPRALKPIGVIYCSDARAKETELHKKFTYCKVYVGGQEWFKKNEELAKYIEENSSKEALSEFEEYIKRLQNMIKNPMHNKLFTFVNNEVLPKLEHTNKIIVFAPPKSGKRIMVHAFKELRPEAYHILITAQNKIDMKQQEMEYNVRGIRFISATNGSIKSREDIDKIQKEICNSSFKEVFIHFDECDYGSANKGATNKKTKDITGFELKELLSDKISNEISTKIICYSATPEEAYFSNVDYEFAMYKPGPEYIGPDAYTSNAISATSFIDFESVELLTQQGKECLELLKDSPKRYGILRLSTKASFKKLLERKNEFEALINNICLGAKVHFIDQTNSSQYSWHYYSENEGKLGFWATLRGKHLFVINQIASRGTEIGFHPDLCFYHDYRTKTTNYNTYAQALGRVFCYSTYYNSDYNKDYDPEHFRNEGVNIALYCDTEVIQRMAKLYSCNTKEEALEIWNGYKFGRKVSTRVNNPNSRPELTWEVKFLEKPYQYQNMQCDKIDQENLRIWAQQSLNIRSVGEKFNLERITINNDDDVFRGITHASSQNSRNKKIIINSHDVFEGVRHASTEKDSRGWPNNAMKSPVGRSGYQLATINGIDYIISNRLYNFDVSTGEKSFLKAEDLFSKQRGDVGANLYKYLAVYVLRDVENVINYITKKNSLHDAA